MDTRTQSPPYCSRARHRVGAIRCARLLALLAVVAASPVAAQLAPTPTAVATAAPTAVSELEEHRAQPETAPVVPEGDEAARRSFDLRIYWEQGLNYRLLRRVRLGRGENMLFDRDATLSGRIGVKLGVDVAGYFENGSLPPLGTRFNLRRALFYTTGEFRFLFPILFKIDLGGVGDALYISDMYVWVRDVPYVGTVKVGQFDAPMSLEALTGSTHETFLEYGSPVDAFAPGLKIGLQIADHSADARMTWAVGYFTDGQKVDVGDDSVSVARVTGRLTWLAVKPATAADSLVHLGISASYVLSSRDRIRYEARPESYLAGNLVDTGDLDTNNAFPFGLELAAKRGPVTLQAEYLASAVDAGPLGDVYFDGTYGSVSWFLTGEQRPYDAALARMGPLVPTHDFEPWTGHWGAWELATRASWLNLSDGAVHGGRMVIFTGGLNWYWDRYIRILFNASVAHLYDGPDDGHLGILQSRFQLVF